MDITYSIGIACYDDKGRKVMIGGAVNIFLYVDNADEEDWALYVKINTDIFVPFSEERNELTEEMARKNAPPLKTFIELLIQFLPVTYCEWEDAPTYFIDCLKLNIDHNRDYIRLVAMGELEFLERTVFEEKKTVEVLNDRRNMPSPLNSNRYVTNPSYRIDGEIVEVNNIGQ